MLSGVDFIKLDDAIKIIEDHINKGNGIIISEDICIKVGKYGPYIKYKGSINVPIMYKYKKNPEVLTLEQCQECINKKLEKDKEKNMTEDELNAKKEKAKKEKEAEKLNKPINHGMIKSSATAGRKKKPRVKKDTGTEYEKGTETGTKKGPKKKPTKK